MYLSMPIYALVSVSLSADISLYLPQMTLESLPRLSKLLSVHFFCYYEPQIGAGLI